MKLTKLTRLAAATALSTLVASAAGVLVMASPAFAAAAVTAAPVAPATTNAADGLPTGNSPYQITLTFSGYTPNTNLAITECASGHTPATEPADASTCSGSLADTSFYTNTTGGGTFTYTVQTATQAANGVVCDYSHKCTIFAGQVLSDFTQPHAFADFDFNAPPPTVKPPTATAANSMTVANLGAANVTISYGPAPTDSNGVTETLNPGTSIVTGPTHGTLSNVSPGVYHYTNTDGTQTADSFVVGGATATCAGASAGQCNPATSAAGPNQTVSVTIQGAVSYPTQCDVTAQPSCQLKQIVSVPVTGADLTMYQATSPTPLVDNLNHTLAGTSCTGPAIVLNGQPQNACGTMGAIYIVNARGTDAGWALSGQISDFLDNVAPVGTTCDTIASFSNHCIPGGNLSWGPVAAVAHDIVPGDTAAVTAGAPVAPPSVLPALLANATGALAGTNAVDPAGNRAQLNPVVEESPNGGLHNSAQTLCSTASTHAGGSFVCGANLVVAVPASAAASGSPYQATLTLTLA